MRFPKYVSRGPEAERDEQMPADTWGPRRGRWQEGTASIWCRLGQTEKKHATVKLSWRCSQWNWLFRWPAQAKHDVPARPTPNSGHAGPNLAEISVRAQPGSVDIQNSRQCRAKPTTISSATAVDADASTECKKMKRSQLEQCTTGIYFIVLSIGSVLS